MLRLIRCEFAKLRRRPIYIVLAFTSILIPLFCAIFLVKFDSSVDAVQGLMSVLYQMSAFLLLIPALVVFASNLLFEEQDHDTLKNLLCVPVGKAALVLAKMFLLMAFSLAFMAAGGLANLCILLIQGWEPVGFWKMFSIGIGLGFMMWAGAMPCILLVTALNKSYIISVIITFFYTAANYLLATNNVFLTQDFGPNPGTFLPGPLAMRWFFQYLGQDSASGQITKLLEELSPYFVSTGQAFAVTGLEAVLFLALIALVYKRQEN